jgi:DNA-binding CsgD family transcriptional regulator
MSKMTDLPNGLLESLTVREREVLSLRAAGMRKRQIMVEMNITWHTVNEYFAKIFFKLAVHSQEEAVAVYQGHPSP